MLDRSTDASVPAHQEQLAASTRFSAEAGAAPGTHNAAQRGEHVTALDFNHGNIYGDSSANANSTNSTAEANAERILTAHFEEKLASNPERLTHFRVGMSQFAQRAAEMHLPQSEISALYSNIDRLLEPHSGGPLSVERRLILAEQVMEHASNPFRISQGSHESRIINALEVRMFDKNPSAAAALIADVALTGSFRTKDGQTFRINAAPHDSSTSEFVYEDTRSHASEIFQVTAANILAEQENRALRGTNHGGQNLRFEQRQSSPQNPTGDTLVAYDPQGRAAKVLAFAPYEATTKNAGQLADTYAAITGKVEAGTFIGRDDVITDQSPNITHIANVSDLERRLSEAKAEGKFPVTMFVNSANEPFWSDSHGVDGDNGHVVNITDFVPGTGPDGKSYALVDNSYRDRYDHRPTVPIEIQTLYSALSYANRSLPYLQEVATRARANGTPDYGKEIDILRIQIFYKLKSRKEIENDLHRTLDNDINYWLHKLPRRERNIEEDKLDQIRDYIQSPGPGGSASGSDSGSGSESGGQ